MRQVTMQALYQAMYAGTHGRFPDELTSSEMEAREMQGACRSWLESAVVNDGVDESLLKDFDEAAAETVLTVVLAFRAVQLAENLRQSSDFGEESHD